MKRLIYICGVLIAVGIGLVISGFILSGKKGFALDFGNRKLIFADEGIVKDDITLDAFDEAEINIPFAGLEIIEGDRYGLEYSTDKNNAVTAEVKDGKLTVKCDNGANKAIKINFGYSGGERYFKLYVPEGTSLKKADVTLDSGSFSMKDIDVADLKIDDDFGSVTIKNMKSDQVNIKCDSGSVKMNDISTGSLSITDEFGSINLESVKADKSKFDLESGSLNLNDFDSSDIEAESEFGSVNIKLVGTSEDYSYDLKTEFGSITLDGDKVGKSEDVSEKTYVDGKGSKKIKVRAESGSIKIDFK